MPVTGVRDDQARDLWRSGTRGSSPYTPSAAATLAYTAELVDDLALRAHVRVEAVSEKADRTGLGWLDPEARGRPRPFEEIERIEPARAIDDGCGKENLVGLS